MTQEPTSEPDIKLPDAEALGRSMTDIAARSQKLVGEWLKRQAAEGVALDPLNVGSAFLEMTAKLLANPGTMMDAQIGLWRDYITLWQNTARRRFKMWQFTKGFRLNRSRASC